MIKNNNTNYALNVVCRWVVGLVFLFSSLSKGVDPLGTTFKVQEYMTSWNFLGMGFEWALPLAQTLSVGLICVEFVVGVLLIANAYRRLSAWLLVLLMLFFTTTTLIDAITNKVNDCGCFGDALKLTNWQTFWKNVALDVPTVWIFLTRGLRRKRRFERDGTVLIAAVAAILVFEMYNIKHEPVVDFRPWKVGRQMVVEHEAMNHITFRNLQDGREVVIDYPNGGWNQVPTEYLDESLWEILTSASDEPFEILADGFSMLDLENEDRAVDVLMDPDGVLMVTIYDLDKVKEKGLTEIRRARSVAEENGLQLVLLCSALPEEVQAWFATSGLEEFDYYSADATAIKAAMRGNPGFMVVRQGVVVDKGRKAFRLDVM